MERDLFFGLEEYFKERYSGWEGAEQFEGTGERLQRAYDELCWPIKEIEKQLEKCFEKVFNDGYSEMLVSGPNTVWTLCPHHLLPCKFLVTIGYIPTGKVLGLSKFTRVADILARRPIMQETYSRELADIIMARLLPEGVGVSVLGHHGCMGARGVKQEVPVTTAVLRGSFLNDTDVRAEWNHRLDREAKV